jgi:hypothetical protein
MNRDTFLETIRRRYLADLRDAYFECEQAETKQLDQEKFQKLLSKLVKHAQMAGMPQSEIEGALSVVVPQISVEIARDGRIQKAA